MKIKIEDLRDQQLTLIYGLRTGKIDVVCGEARCGKTTGLQAYSYMFDDQLILTPTHAARQPYDKGTLVEVIDTYLLNHEISVKITEDNKPGGKVIGKKRIPNPKYDKVKLIVVDEMSMVSLDKYNKLVSIVEGKNINLERAGEQLIRLAYIGDPYQIYPVELINTTLENYKIGPYKHKMKPRLWMVKREGIPDRNISFIEDLSEAPKDTVWLTPTNDLRRQMNNLIRPLRYHSGLPRKGEKLICGSNAHSKRGFFNNGIYTVEEVVTFNSNKKIKRDKKPDITFRDCYFVKFLNHGNKVKRNDARAIREYMKTNELTGTVTERIVEDCYMYRVLKQYVLIERKFLDLKWQIEQMKNDKTFESRFEWEFAYASTVHSAQGLGFENVGLIVRDTDFKVEDLEEIESLCYTAVTRAPNVWILVVDGHLDGVEISDVNRNLEEARKQEGFEKLLTPFDMDEVRAFFVQEGFLHA